MKQTIKHFYKYGSYIVTDDDIMEHVRNGGSFDKSKLEKVDYVLSPKEMVKAINNRGNIFEKIEAEDAFYEFARRQLRMLNDIYEEETFIDDKPTFAKFLADRAKEFK